MRARAIRRPGHGRLDARPVRATRSRDARGERQAGVADRGRVGARQRSRHGARLVGRAARRTIDRGPPRPAARDAADVARARPAAAAGGPAGRRARLAHAAPDRRRRVGAGRAHRRGRAARRQSAGRDLRPPGRGRCRRFGGVGRPINRADLVDEAVSRLRERVGQYVFAEGNQTWADALAVRLGGRTLAVVEIGTGGQVGALLGGADFLVHAELERADPDLEQRAERAREIAAPTSAWPSAPPKRRATRA